MTHSEIPRAIHDVRVRVVRCPEACILRSVIENCRGLRALTALVLASLLTASLAYAQWNPPARPRITREALQAAVAGATQAPPTNVQLAYSIVDATTGAPLVESRPNAQVNPASNAKLFTAAAALLVLGRSHRFETTVHARTDSNQRNAVPSLIVHASGDPTLRTADFDSIAARIKSQGVAAIDGILIDDTLFSTAPVPGLDEDATDTGAYRGPISAFAVNRSTYRLDIRPGTQGGPAVITSLDAPSYVSIENTTVTNGQSDQTTVQQRPLVVRGEPDRMLVVVGGSVAARNRVTVAKRRVENARAYAAALFQERLREAGIDVRGIVRFGAAGAPRRGATDRLVATHRSPRLPLLLRALGKESDNFTAEMLTRSMIARADSPGATDLGVQEMLRVLRAAHFVRPGPTPPTLLNGSGYHRDTRVAVRDITHLLVAIRGRADLAQDYLDHLSVAGADGTLRERLRTWATSRAVRAKTGSLRGVAALSGYVMVDPAPIAFSIIANDSRMEENTNLRAYVDRVADAIIATVLGQAPSAGTTP